MCNSRRKFSVRSMLQITNLLILLAVLIAFTLYFALTESANIRRNAFQAIGVKVGQISSYMDDEATILSTVSQNVIYSNLVKDRFLLYTQGPSAVTPSEKYEQVENTRVLTDLLIAIIGPVQPVSQIYLYTLSGQRFGVGRNTASDVVDMDAQPWLKELMLGEGNQYWAYAPDAQLDRFYTSPEPQSFITLYSLYFNRYNVVQGVVEVKSPSTELHKKIDDLGLPYGEKVFLFDSYGGIVYASEDIPADEYYRYAANARDAMVLENGVERYRNENGEHIFRRTSDITGFTALIAASNSQLMQPVYNHILANILILAAISLAAFLLSTVVANIITKPVKKIYHAVGQINLRGADKNANFPPVQTRLYELDALYTSLVDMQHKAKEFREREATLHDQEMQSRMLALQSQMNPHFLYNSLSAIHSMADDGMGAEIQAMCQTISRILRYISSDRELLVPLESELEHMTDYLRCVQLRYCEDLAYGISIPTDMNQIRVPKLCLQLIVENSIKFATQSVRPPWRLNISGTKDAEGWQITISDNGAGFPPEIMTQLSAQIEEINETGLLPSLELNGMGLLNIYIRFKLLYQGKHIFRIGNLPGGGAFVTIGGIYDA